MKSAQYIPTPRPDDSRSRKAASCQASYCVLLGESHQGLEGRLVAASDSPHTSRQALDTEMDKEPLGSRWAECLCSCGLEWGLEAVALLLLAALNRPRWKEIGRGLFFSRYRYSELNREDTARDHLGLPYLGPVPWVGASCHKQCSLAGLRGLLCGPCR